MVRFPFGKRFFLPAEEIFSCSCSFCLCFVLIYLFFPDRLGQDQEHLRQPLPRHEQEIPRVLEPNAAVEGERAKTGESAMTTSLDEKRSLGAKRRRMGREKCIVAEEILFSWHFH